MMINWSVTVPTSIALLTNKQIQAAKVVLTVTALVPATACQLILFTTKLLPVVHEKTCPEAQITSVTNACTIYQQQQPSHQSILTKTVPFQITIIIYMYM